MILKNILIGKLFAIGAVKRGTFTLKSGRTSEIYVDMRVLIGYPNMYRYLLEYALEKFPDFFNGIDSVTGIHFGGLPFANYISFMRGLPQIYIRDTQKAYGTGKRIEGDLSPCRGLLLVDDVLTTGGSIDGALHVLDDYAVKPAKILVLVDRSEPETRVPFEYHTLFTLRDILQFRPEFYENPLANRLLATALQKSSNIIFSADYTRAEQVLAAVDTVGPHVIAVKLHADIIDDFSREFVEKLRALAEKHSLTLIEDRKFADIPEIVAKQARTIREWAHAATIHLIAGERTIAAVETSVIPVVEMSCEGNLIDKHYTATALEMLQKHAKSVAGIVCQRGWRHPLEWLTLSPGIHLECAGDGAGQQWTDGSSSGLLWIVGRGISGAENSEAAAIKYKSAGWHHFKKF